MVHLSVFKGPTCCLLGCLGFVSDSKKAITETVRESQRNKKRDTEREERHEKRRKREGELDRRKET